MCPTCEGQYTLSQGLIHLSGPPIRLKFWDDSHKRITPGQIHLALYLEKPKNSNIFLTGHKIPIQICILKLNPDIFFGLLSSLRKCIYVN